jgi:hypothetical protein
MGAPGTGTGTGTGTGIHGKAPSLPVTTVSGTDLSPVSALPPPPPSLLFMGRQMSRSGLSSAVPATMAPATCMLHGTVIAAAMVSSAVVSRRCVLCTRGVCDA